MTGVALGLVLSAAIIHATWNLLAKKSAGGALFVWLSGMVTLVLYAPAAVFVLTYQTHALTLQAWGFIAASAIVHLLYWLSLQRGYQVADLSVVYPVARGFGPLLSTIGATVVLQERPTLLALLGAGATVAGVFLVVGGPRQLARRDLGTRRGALYGIVTGSFIASYTLLDGYAVRVVAVAPLLLDYFGNAIRTALLTPVAIAAGRQREQLWRRHWKLALGVGALAPLSYILVLIAVQTTPVSRVAPARELSTLIATLCGTRLLKEPDAPTRMAGAALIALGVVALAFG